VFIRKRSVVGRGNAIHGGSCGTLEDEQEADLRFAGKAGNDYSMLG
jgi:hypothetical protein